MRSMFFLFLLIVQQIDIFCRKVIPQLLYGVKIWEMETWTSCKWDNNQCIKTFLALPLIIFTALLKMVES